MQSLNQFIYKSSQIGEYNVMKEEIKTPQNTVEHTI